MRFIIFLFLSLFSLRTAAQWSTHIEAETSVNSFGVQKIPCAEGSFGNKTLQINSHDWADYSFSVPSDGIYEVSVRVGGTLSTLWVTDTTGAVIGRVYIKKGLMDFATDQTFDAYSGYIYLKASTGRTRIQFRQTPGDYRPMNISFDWFEISSTNLLVSNNFDPDWDVITGGPNLSWKSNSVDSIRSLYESSPGFFGWIKQTARPDAFTIQTNGAFMSYGVFNLRKSDTSTAPNVRAEIYKGYAPYQTMWYAFDFLSPTSTAGDGLPHTLVQWHGGGALSPCVSIRIENEKYVVKVLWSSVLNPTVHMGETTYVLGDYHTGEWNKFVMKVKWAYDNTGQLQIWQNGVEVVTRLNLPNCYNDGYFPYFKLGIYKWGWRGGQAVNGVWVPWATYSPEDEVVHCYDNVRIGGPGSDYTEVSK